MWYKRLCMTQLTSSSISAQPLELDTELQEMMEAGLHFGHKTSKTHPKMKPYIYGVRNTIHIFNLAKTREKLHEALSFIRTLKEEGKILVFVGTKVQVKEEVKTIAQELNVPYVTERWIGGMLTNFDTILRRITRLKELEEAQQNGSFEKYTKKEQALFTKELQGLEKKFGGLKNLTKLPDVVFICDLDQNMLAAKEAKEKGAKVIAITDANIDPTYVDYVIPANDDAVSSVKYILGKVKEALK